MADENTTHPNAYRMEATEKRRQATILSAEADTLEAQADELEGKTKPEVVETDTTAQPVDDKPKDKKLFSK